MDLNYSPQEEDFRSEVRDFLQQHLPARLSGKVRTGKRLTKADVEEWHAILHRRGWLAGNWPVEHGGQGWSPVQRHIFDVETALAGAPPILPFGVHMLGPVLIRFGTPEQKRHLLPRILDGTDWWCQGYSEPGAGSDLASLKTRAIRDGDHYVVNGQKTWTTLGQYADWIFCLVRTDPQAAKPQEGISFLLIDMTSPGVEVRPIILLDGEHEVNEIFFTDVRVPVANLVGEENQGWTIAKYLLLHERTTTAGIGGSMAALEQLKRIAATERKNGRPLAEDPFFAADVARVEIDLENLKTTNLRMLAAAQSGAAPAEQSAMLKIRGTEIRQQLTSLTRKALGSAARPFVHEALDENWNGEPVVPDHAAAVAANYFNNRKLSIFAGSNEVQRDIIARSLAL
ncbi:pimeloyl-CoA dehydrogenase large subunit [Sphingobium sp. 22B]|uniref:acyl-CoA dehydrogenase family protein n=1 Tax=unclassified Sphingobium TaxID=2611147 RepID=UPI000781D0C5|nr:MULTISPECIES: acyl-CoA dehydrogenase family protein [unclassified Sphingobium]KXU32697.1 pimeloyl-CoA dehydrogenase large subunit [Sphingobium sp. AM]KYC32775.1 pimeloyl-CoA dehydrogenase large subunit [Sphingobium sp. 22B]OAP31665.1 pimeloyl-CoA dehydrogenase large subunit [Sphingobium sp. 20006FA]